MTEKTLGAAALVREGDEAFARYRSLVEEHGPPPCVVRHPDAGGQCQRAAIMEVYGLNFCEVHEGEARAGALRETVAALQAVEFPASEHELAALRRAYPVIPGRVLEDTPDFNYDSPLRESTPIDWH